MLDNPMLDILLRSGYWGMRLGPFLCRYPELLWVLQTEVRYFLRYRIVYIGSFRQRSAIS